MPKPETTSAGFHHVPGTVSLTSLHTTLKHPHCKVHVAGVTKPAKPTRRKAATSHHKPLFTHSPRMHAQEKQTRRPGLPSPGVDRRMPGSSTGQKFQTWRLGSPTLVPGWYLPARCWHLVLWKLSGEFPWNPCWQRRRHWARLSERSESTPYRGAQLQPSELPGPPLSHPSSARPLPAPSNAVCPPPFLLRPIFF